MSSLPSPSAYRLSPEYAAVADVPVKFSVDPRALSRPAARRPARRPDDIFQYDDSLERRIVAKAERRELKAATARQTAAAVVADEEGQQQQQQQQQQLKRLTEAMSNIALGTSSRPPVSPAATSSAAPTPSPRPASLSPPAAQPALPLQERVEELAVLYLPDDTAERRQHFTRLFIASRQLAQPPADVDVLSAFFLYDGDVNRATGHLRAFVQLKELGFADDNITQALLLNSAKFDEALEHLMRNC